MAIFPSSRLTTFREEDNLKWGEKNNRKVNRRQTPQQHYNKVLNLMKMKFMMNSRQVVLWK